MEVRTTIKVPIELVEQVKASAKADGRSWTIQIVQLAKEALAKRGKK